MAGARREAVAIVDDDEAVRDSLRLLLEVIGQRAECFASAREFLSVDIADVACLLLDYQMPGMSGLELAERLQANGEMVPILLMTGMPSPRIVARAARLGITRVVEKPPSEDDVLDFVAAARRVRTAN